MYENQVIQKQIAFDIDTKVAEKIFGSSYRSIYFYIEDTMKKNGYKHLQGSVYQSISPVGYMQVITLLERMIEKKPGLEKCFRDMRLTDITAENNLNYLFEYDRTEVTDKMLYNNFYITNNRILHNVNNKQNMDKIFEKSATNKKFLIILMIIATYCLITIPPIFNYGQPETLIFALLFSGIGFSVLFRMLFGKTPIPVKIFGLIWGLGFGGMPWTFMVLPAITQDISYLIGYVVGIICVLGMILCLVYLPKRTKYGNEMLGKLKGFKNFLETVEKERLKALVMQNPNYFYDILPYTYVLGVSDKWIKKFESISLQAPSWYDSSNGFDFSSFGTFIKSTMVSAQSAMSSSPSSSSGGSSSGGGGSSGGGSSGGGSGGGGGGSW